MKYSLILFALLIASINSQNYIEGGDDWTCPDEKQSPIDIDTIKGACDSQMAFDIIFEEDPVSTFIEMTNASYRLTASFSRMFATDINGDLYGYEAEYLDIKIPGEHEIEGDSFDAEIQIIHSMTEDFALKAGDYGYGYAIVSIPINIGSSDTVGIYDDLTITSIGNATVDIDYADLLGNLIPDDKVYYTYQGSFTYPDCEETVNWYVLDSPLYITQEIYDAIKLLYAGDETFAAGRGNNRHIQPLNGRSVKKGGVECEEQFVYFFSFFILYIFINYFIFKAL